MTVPLDHRPVDEEALQRLTRLDHFERAAIDGALPQLLGELQRAAAALGPDDRWAEALNLLHRALRIDLAFLVEHPEEVFSCVYNRCRLHESAAATAFAAFAPDSPTALPAAIPSTALGEILDRWTNERKASGRAWWRSLRPPEHALAGPLVEEYRGGAEHAASMRIDPAGNRLQLASLVRRGLPREPTSESRTAELVEWRLTGWDRATGRPLEETSVFEPRWVPGLFVNSDRSLRIEATGWGQAKLHDGATGSVVADIPLGDRDVTNVAFFADGSRVAIVGREDEGEGYLMIFDLASREVSKILRTGGSVHRLAVSPDGRRVAVQTAHHVFVLEWQIERLIATLAGDTAHLAFSSDGRLLFTSAPGVVRTWDLERGSGPPGLSGVRDEQLTHAAFSPDGSMLLTGTFLCDARTGAPRAELAYSFGYYLEGAPAMDAFRMTDDRIVFLAERITVWDACTGRLLVDGRDRPPFVRHTYRDLIAISADGRAYAATKRRDRLRSSVLPEDVSVIDIDSGRERIRFPITGASCLAFSPDGLRLAAGSYDDVVRIWSLATGQLLVSFTGHAGPPSGVAFLGDGHLAVSGAEEDAVRVWNSHTGKELSRRALDRDDPSYTFFSAGEPGGERRYWRATPSAVALVEAWAGTRPSPHPWVAKQAPGATQIVHRETGQEVWIPTEVSVIAHPDAPIWAGGPVHFMVETGRSQL
jgi:WD40 repeat protein